MTHTRPDHAAAGPRATDQAQPAPAGTGPGHRTGPAPGQRLLAGALAAASPATGANALVQAAKALAQFWPPR